MSWLAFILGLALFAIGRWAWVQGDRHAAKADHWAGTLIGKAEAATAEVRYREAQWILSAAIGSMVLSCLIAICTP